ncbi:uncharacterized protein TNCV_3904861 [Trichonephila clavipes]|nr:uncharacterized protein TNCV_3904861 [Trichonephila clavipes]
MIVNYVNEQHGAWDQFLREFAYAIRTTVNETTGKTPAELFLGRKLITLFQKLVMVSDGSKFAIEDIARLFEGARRKAKAKHEKWEKYYNRRRRDVQIKGNDWVLIVTHPEVWQQEKWLTIKVDQVRVYRHRKCDETEIGTGSSDNGSLRDESSGFDRVQLRSIESQDGKKKGSEVKRELEEKGLSFKNDKGPERKIQKGSEHRVPKRALSSNYSTNYNLPKFRKKSRIEETRGRHNREDQFDPEKADEGTTAPTSKSKQDQTTGMPDEEGINNGKTRKGEERVQESLYPWRSCSFVNPTPLAHADTSRDVLRRGGTSHLQNELFVDIDSQRPTKCVAESKLGSDSNLLVIQR